MLCEVVGLKTDFIMKIDKLLDKYIIVVDKEEHKIVYDVDDSRIFSVHITGCGRGARNAVLSTKTFKRLRDAEKGIKYLESCHWNCKFKAIKVSELENISKKGWDFLLEDIDDYNFTRKLEKDFEKQSRKESLLKYNELEKEAINLIKEGRVDRIYCSEEGVYKIVVYKL